MKSQGIIIIIIVVINYFLLIVRVLLKPLKYVNRNVSLLNGNIFYFPDEYSWEEETSA